ncbi:MAG: ComEC/Rec2 family competence protein [Rikenellaceae bacterium]|nr:ComEC/Rec2 family competence protein [Rikenellaceae bacterium]MCL2692647.1 ComEC/Rec2 family competence protein [Rikenellaceae bacterium]
MRPIDRPFLKVVIPAMAGMVAARAVSVPAAMAIAGLVALFACTVIFYRRQQFGKAQIYLWFAVFAFFFAAGTVTHSHSTIPQGERVELVAQIVENPYQQGRWQRTTANVGYFRPAGDPDAQWTRTRERIQLYIDTCYTVTTGRQIAFRGWLNAVDTTGSSYGRLMQLRGQHGRLYLTPGNLIAIAPHTSRTPAYYSSRLQNTAIERFGRLRLSPDQSGVVTAMVVGDKRGIDRDVRRSYTLSGAAHLLAVSGLHVGIVFILINLVLYLLPVLPRGHIYKNVAAIIVVWLYAAMAGLAPSVIRAAMMASFAQVALASGTTRNALNIMLGSAVVMLALNPNWWGDPSFMLSYAAVLALSAFFWPLFRLVRSRWKLLNVFSSVMVVGLVASLGTAPLVIWWFGAFPAAGIVINPVVMLTAHIIVMFGVLWVVLPLPFLNPLFSWVLGKAAALQNGAAEWCASMSWQSIPIELPQWGVVTIYVGYIALAVWVNRPQAKSTRPFTRLE